MVRESKSKLKESLMMVLFLTPSKLSKRISTDFSALIFSMICSAGYSRYSITEITANALVRVATSLLLTGSVKLMSLYSIIRSLLLSVQSFCMVTSLFLSRPKEIFFFSG